MKDLNSRVARHLGVEPGDLMHVVERGDQIVVILTDYRKYVFPASVLPAEPEPQAEKPQAVAADKVAPKVRRKPGL